MMLSEFFTERLSSPRNEIWRLTWEVYRRFLRRMGCFRGRFILV